MKKTLFLTLFSFFIYFNLLAQREEGFSSVSEAKEIASQILLAAGKKANFLVKEANVPNAVAVLQNGRRYILYNQGFIEKLTRITGTKWAAVSVLAHEIGHHLSSHSVNGKTIPMASELDADEFSGFVLRKMGAPLEDAQAAMRTLASERATRTHPARADRLNSIETGWDEADALYGSIAIVPRPVETQVENTEEQTQTPPTEIDSRYILANIQFHADPHTRYYVTSRHNVIKVKNDQLHVIGKLIRLNSRDYPFMIADEQENKVYINSTGAILNRQGGKIGKLVVHRS